jgi:Flp pilus assembly protein TadD
MALTTTMAVAQQAAQPTAMPATATPLPAAPTSIQAAAPRPGEPTGSQSEINSINTAITQAQRLLAAAQYSDAIQTLDGALKTAPRDPRLRFTYGLVLSEQGKPTEALDVFTQLTQDFPELPEPFNNLAVLYASRGELERAKLALDNALRALPTYSVAHENLGDVYLRMALRSYQQAQSNDRGNSTAQGKLTMTRELLTKVAPSSATPAAAPAVTTKP